MTQKKRQTRSRRPSLKRVPAKTTPRPLLSWRTVLLTIAGISVVYVGVLQAGFAPFAMGQDAPYCPAKQACTGGDCDKHPDCKSGKCSASCPGNCGGHKA